MVGKCPLQRVQRSIGAETFNRDHAAPVGFNRENQTREHGFIIEQYGARAAFAHAARVLGTYQREFVAEHVNQERISGDGKAH